jgi:catechol 2,3-dioxygenase-like lactoylglutathione lyase family enzyme
MFELQIDHVAFGVRDPETTARWYEQMLGLERAPDVPWPHYPIVMRAGATSIALFPLDEARDLVSNGRGDTLRHVAFRTDRGRFVAAIEGLRECGIHFEREDNEICESA